MAKEPRQAHAWVEAVLADPALGAALRAAAGDDEKVAVARAAGLDVTVADLEAVRSSLLWGYEIGDEELTEGRPEPPWAMPPEHWRAARLEPAG